MRIGEKLYHIHSELVASAVFFQISNLKSKASSFNLIALGNTRTAGSSCIGPSTTLARLTPLLI
jgi:hypothetical protein